MNWVIFQGDELMTYCTYNTMRRKSAVTVSAFCLHILFVSGLGWKTIDKLIAEESNTIVYKSLNDLAPQYLSCLFTRNSAGEARTLRNTSTDLRIPKKTSLNGQRGFSYRGVKLWNSLPAEAKLASSFGIFKKLLHSH